MTPTKPRRRITFNTLEFARSKIGAFETFARTPSWHTIALRNDARRVVRYKGTEESSP